MKLLSKHIRTILIVMLFTATFFSFGYFKRYYVPKIKRWLLTEIEQQSQKHSPLRVWPQDVEINLFPVGATFYDVKILPKSSAKGLIKPTRFKEIEMSLSPWSLFKGEMTLSRIAISDGEISIHLPQALLTNQTLVEKNKAASKKFDVSLSMLDAIPIENLELKKISLDISDPSQRLEIKNLNFDLTNRYRSLRTNIEAQSVKYSKKGHKQPFEGDVLAQALLDSDGIYISQLKLNHKMSELKATGTVSGDLFNNNFKDANLKIAGRLEMHELHQLISEFQKVDSLPKMSGMIQFESDLNFKNENDYRANFALKSKELSIAQYRIGQIQSLGKIDEKRLQLSKLKIEDEFGELELDNFNLNLTENFDLSATVVSKELDLKKFLKALNLPNVPVYADFKGQLPCRGQMKSQFKITCEGQLTGNNLRVASGKRDENTIVSFSDYEINGSVDIDQRSVKYNTNLRIGETIGESSGNIDYENGFLIKYSTPKLNFKDVTNLVNLKPEGSAAIKGSTQGNSQTATMQLDAVGEQLWLKDFLLGDAKFSVDYEKSIISVNKIFGNIHKTRYEGDLSVNLKTDTLNFSGSSPFLDAEDLLKIFGRRVQLPFAVTGTGAAKIEVSGPFEFSLLSYNLTSSMFRGTIADEPYDQLHFDVVSKNGQVKSNRIQIARGNSRISATGHANPDGQIELDIIGRQFQIEQFENLNRLKLNLTGNLDFEAKLSRYILKPDLDFRGRMTRMTVDDTAAKDSSLNFSISADKIKGDASFLGTAVKVKFAHSLDPNGTTDIDIDTEKWNFAQVFSIFTDTLRAGNYTTSTSGKFSAQIPNNAPFQYNALLQIDDLQVRNGTVEMRSKEPLILKAQKGRITAKNFEITGENSYLRMLTKPNSESELNITLEGRFNLALAALFTPFLDDIRGTMSFSQEIAGSYKNPQLNGSAFLENGFFKLKGFAHPFDQVNSDATLTNNRIDIHSIKGKLASGQFTARGQIELKTPSQMPVDIRGEFQDTKFNVPDGFFTRGSGDLFVKGDWFPYVVGVNYKVVSGNIERKGNENSKSTVDVKPSIYLPKFLSAQRFTPVVLDLNIDLKKQLPVRFLINRIDIHADVIGQMRVAGPPESPLLTGRINIAKGGKVAFRSNVFEIQSGYVEYDNAPAENPTLNLQASAVVRAQLRDGTTRDYDVDLVVQGTASQPKIIMSSQPPLVENELISLLTLGFISEENIEDGETTAGEKLANTSYQLGSAFLNEQLGINRVLEKQLGLHFDFNSSYDTSDKAEKHKFTLSKQWSPKFGTSASREIGKTNSNNVKAEYKLNKNLSVIGQWDGKEPTGSDQQTTSDKDLNIFGLDIEYKVDFR